MKYITKRTTTSPQPGHVYLVACLGTNRGLLKISDCIAEEARLHRVASQYRVHGEWFEPPDYWKHKLKKQLGLLSAQPFGEVPS